MSKYGLYNNDPVQRTFSGLWINILDPHPNTISIEDIAHSLSQQCRFGGHLSEFYSVAEHSVRCCELVPQEDKLAALLHDASEAYLMDIPRPAKHQLVNYGEIEHRIMSVIAKKFGFQWPMSDFVVDADEKMLQLEYKRLVLMENSNFYPFPMHQAKAMFLRYFKELTNDR